MPIHDWTRVRANRFHDFHQSWTVALSNHLNNGRLPTGYYSLLEKPSVLLARMNANATYRADDEEARYAAKANSITIRTPTHHDIAVIQIVSPGNKSSRVAQGSFVRQMVTLLKTGIHLLLVDLFPAVEKGAPEIHQATWSSITDREALGLPEDRPLAVVAYEAAGEINAYLQEVGVGAPLPESPLFLAPRHYINCPLEESYRTAWEQFPPPLRGPLESPP